MSAIEMYQFAFVSVAYYHMPENFEGPMIQNQNIMTFET